MAMALLPPAPDKCQRCAVDHDPTMPHDRTSLYYQYWFYGQNGRWPAWKDAMDHCTQEVKEAWINALSERGIGTDE